MRVIADLVPCLNALDKHIIPRLKQVKMSVLLGLSSR